MPELKAKYGKDFQDHEDGFRFSAEHALPYQMQLDLPKTASRVDTAFFIIQGKDDVMTPTQAAVDYFKLEKAPEKELILIPAAGHFALMTAPDAFLTEAKSHEADTRVGEQGHEEPNAIRPARSLRDFLALILR